MTSEISPRLIARLTGIFYLIVIIGGVVAQGVIADSLINFRSSGVTARNILQNEGQYRIAFTVFLVEMTAQFVTAVLFYTLLKPVNAPVARVMLVLELTGAVIKTVARVFFLVPLAVLHNPGAYSGFSAEQVNSLALFLLRINNDGAAVALAFFGPATFLIGWLVFKSNFLPRWMGVISLIGGTLWTTYYWPPLGRSLFMISALFALAGVIVNSMWLIVKGVNETRWYERAAAQRSSAWA